MTVTIQYSGLVRYFGSFSACRSPHQCSTSARTPPAEPTPIIPIAPSMTIRFPSRGECGVATKTYALPSFRALVGGLPELRTRTSCVVNVFPSAPSIQHQSNQLGQLDQSTGSGRES